MVYKQDPRLERTSLPLIHMLNINLAMGFELLGEGMNWKGGIMKHRLGEDCCVEWRRHVVPNPILVRALLSL
jgi:hypothetical protein